MPDNYRKHRSWVPRIVWLFNHSKDGDAWYEAAVAAGYTIDTDVRATHDEKRLSFDGEVVALLHDFGDGEVHGYVFIPEADARLRDRIWWRLTHPFTPKRELPWPRKEQIDWLSKGGILTDPDGQPRLRGSL